MPAQTRVSDAAKCDACKHGCPACPHPVVGPAIEGSPDVNINDLPAVRKGDHGMSVPCCNINMWEATAGSGTVFINGKAAVRKGDATKHCNGGGNGTTIAGSDNVNVGD